MEHTDFTKIIQSFLPIIVFVLWTMFSGAGKKKRKARQSGYDTTAQSQTGRTDEIRQETPNTFGISVPGEKTEKLVIEKIEKTDALSPVQIHKAFSEATPHATATVKQRFEKLSPDELQNRIVWLEILGKPIALRE